MLAGVSKQYEQKTPNNFIWMDVDQNWVPRKNSENAVWRSLFPMLVDMEMAPSATISPLEIGTKGCSWTMSSVIVVEERPPGGAICLIWRFLKFGHSTPNHPFKIGIKKIVHPWIIQLLGYPLVNAYITNWKDPPCYENGKIHYKSPFSVGYLYFRKPPYVSNMVSTVKWETGEFPVTRKKPVMIRSSKLNTDPNRINKKPWKMGF